MKNLAPWFILLAGILWGSMGIFVRVLNQDGIEAIDIVAIRAITTTFCLLILLLLLDRQLLKIKIRDIWCFLGTGVLSILFFNYCYFHTIELTSMSVAAVLLYSSPAFVMLLSYFLFHEQITICKWVSLVLVIIGCAFVTGIVGNAGVLTMRGIFTGLGAGLGYALYSIFSRYAIEKGYHSLTILFYTFLFAMIGVIPLADLSLIAKVTFSAPVKVGFVFAFGIVSTVLPYLVYTAGLVYVENGKAAILAAIEPVMATVLGVVLYQEKISAWNILGILFVFGSIVLSNASGVLTFSLFSRNSFQG